ncbi:MAG: (2Fe-2S) ferredoxin domain-containing protein [Roseiflexaceae bacterium]|nr:(2Fe-2S) ferredoxin domain-containing protein [Roseiflexaceae bacterium]
MTTINQNAICHLCGGDDCRDGAKKIRRELERLIEQRGLASQVELRMTKCQGRCEDGPVLTVMPGANTYGELNTAAVAEIVDQHLIRGQPVRARLLKKAAKKLKALKR